VSASPLNAKYGRPVDRDSAYERLAARLAPAPTRAPAHEVDIREPAPRRPARPRARTNAPDEGGVVGQVLGSPAFRSFARSAASALGREITRGLFGNRRR
jgi:hypothetical protein